MSLLTCVSLSSNVICQDERSWDYPLGITSQMGHMIVSDALVISPATRTDGHRLSLPLLQGERPLDRRQVGGLRLNVLRAEFCFPEQ